jgi:hypothetical protein
VPAVGETIVVDGLAGLQRAFAAAGPNAKKELRDALKEAAEPVRVDAELLARTQISRIGVPWSQMRVGVTARTVYVAPKRRSRFRNRRRPNLAGLLLNRSMVPALQLNQEQIVVRAEKAMGDVAVKWGRGG